MGSYVGEELRYALGALQELDEEQAAHVSRLDRQVNAIRFKIEERCFMIVATQHPAASDLRLIFAAANMIVDLERMGDQAKGVAKLIPDLRTQPDLVHPVELRQMGTVAGEMLTDALRAFAEADTALAQSVAQRDTEVDALYANVFTQIMYMLAKTSDEGRVRVVYQLLRVARELERFADLVGNFAERSIYLFTGEMPQPSRGPSAPSLNG
jgi:phosphate transport system protein